MLDTVKPIDELILTQLMIEDGISAPEFIQEDDIEVVIWRTDQVTDQAIDQATPVDKRIIQIVNLLDKPRKNVL